MNYKHYSDGVVLTTGQLTPASSRREGAQPGRDQTIALRAAARKAPPYVRTPDGGSSSTLLRLGCIARTVYAALP